MDTDTEPVAPPAIPEVAEPPPPLATGVSPSPSPAAIQTPPCKHVAVAESTPTPVHQPQESQGVKKSKWLIADGYDVRMMSSNVFLSFAVNFSNC